jgi:hypothetical protein
MNALREPIVGDPEDLFDLLVGKVITETMLRPNKFNTAGSFLSLFTWAARCLRRHGAVADQCLVAAIRLCEADWMRSCAAVGTFCRRSQGGSGAAVAAVDQYRQLDALAAVVHDRVHRGADGAARVKNVARHTTFLPVVSGQRPGWRR